ncbi:hypothetical protein PIB30_073835 [Stylosanthes scabra]|uniref:Uncharacterized protein n=1 Tax=Stylosanthes scabra TaxID=79078 RepID=A0ABU6SR08_9FABA|nr:hypothetical protein [Stylosanthes scabra]
MARNSVRPALAILMIGLVIYSAVGEVQDVVPKQRNKSYYIASKILMSCNSYKITSSYLLFHCKRSRIRVAPKTPEKNITSKAKLMNCFADCNTKYEIGSSDIIRCVRECYRKHMNI